MTKINFNRMPRYEEFCAQQKKQQQIKESCQELSIEVPFWDDAIQKISQEIHKVAGIADTDTDEQKIDFDILTNYVSSKFFILGRDISNKSDMILSHISDLLFFYYGDSFLGGDIGFAYDTEALGAKALVLSSLADTIYHKILVDAGLDIENEADKKAEEPRTVAKVSLARYDDSVLPFESKFNRIAGFETYSAMLKENVAKINAQHYDKALNFCLDKLKHAGGLKLDNLIKIVEDEEHNDLKDYLSCLVDDYLKDAKLLINEQRDYHYDRNVIKQARTIFSTKIVESLMDKISAENKIKKGAGK